jgi:hypothetical protein
MVLDLLTATSPKTRKRNFVGLLLKILLISLFLFSFQSCDLKLDEEFEIPGVALDDSIVGITDQYEFLEVDTLYFTPGQNMSFYLRFKQQEVDYYRYIKSVEFLLNGNEFKPNNGYNYNFTMPDIPATYYLTAKINCSVRMGTIANITGLEDYLFEKNWVLIIYEFENQSPSYVNYSFVDGRLKIEWEKCPLPFIKGYRFYDVTYENNPSLVGKTDFNYLIDSAYRGYSGYRKIRAVTRGNSEIAWGSYSTEGPFPQMTVITSTDPCEKRKVFWNVPKYYNNVASTQFYINDVLYSTSFDVYDTVRFIDNTSIGNTDQIHIHFTGSQSNNQQSFAYSAVKATALSGYKYSSETYSRVFPATDILFLNLEQEKYLISYLSSGVSTGDTLIINSFKNSSFTTSPDGTKFAFLTNSGEIKYGEVNNLNQLITTPSVTNSSLLKISDNGIACVKSGSYSLMFYDLNSMVSIESFNLDTQIEKIIDFSSNAENFSVKTWNTDIVYKRINGILNKLHEFPLIYYSIVKFDHLNPEQFFYWDRQVFSCRNINNSEINYSYSLIGDEILHVDIANNRMLVIVGSSFRITRITDGAILNEIPFIGNCFENSSILVGNRIVFNSLIHCF